MSNPKPPQIVTDYPRIDQWVVFQDDGTVRIRTGKVEIGQGIGTALVQIAADELDVSPQRFQLISGDTRESPDEGFTAGSMSVLNSGRAIRLAVSGARKLMLEEAAKLLQTKVENLDVADGNVLNSGSETDLTYWTLAGSVDFTQTVLDQANPKPLDQLKLIGTSMPRTDLPGKVMGNASFIHDIDLDGMLHGRVLHPPLLTTPLESLDEATLNADPEILHVVRSGSFIGVICAREDHAVRALAKLEKAARWGANVEAPDDIVSFMRAAEGETEISQEEGDPSVKKSTLKFRQA